MKILWEPLVFHVTNAMKPSETIPLVFPSVLSQQQEYITTRPHCPLHWVKSVRIRSYSGPHFPVFELNRERYSVSFCIQSKCGKMRNRISPNTDFFTQCCSAWQELFLMNWFFIMDTKVTSVCNKSICDRELILSRWKFTAFSGHLA